MPNIGRASLKNSYSDKKYKVPDGPVRLPIPEYLYSEMKNPADYPVSETMPVFEQRRFRSVCSPVPPDIR